jgi:N-acetylmuramoyl-L-alanine amidase
MRRCLLSILFLLCCAALAGAAEWQVVKIGGRDFLTLDNLAQFYGFGEVQRSNKGFLLRTTGRSLRGEANSVEFFINGLKFNLSYPVAEHGDQLCVSRMDLTKVIEPVLRPSRIKNAEKINTIVLDAGHGGHDNGAPSAYGFEKNYALDVVNRTRYLLKQAGFNVVLTRSADVFVPLEERCRIANQYHNALFISVHFNSGGAGTGLETYTLAPRGVPSMMADGPRISDLDALPGHACDAQNMALATATHAALVVRSQMFDRGIKRARFVVIRDITIPGVLIEGGFMSNSNDARMIASSTYRQTMASCIVQAVQNYRRAVGAVAPEMSRSIPTVREAPVDAAAATIPGVPDPAAPAPPPEPAQQN